MKNNTGKCEGNHHVVIHSKKENMIELAKQMHMRAGLHLTNEVKRLLGYK